MYSEVRGRQRSFRGWCLAVVITVGLVVVGCSRDGGDEASLTIYSGRDEAIVAAAFERFETDTGIELEVRFGDSADLAALIQAEGADSPADVFMSQSPGALGFLSSQGLLGPVAPESLGRVEPAFRSAHDDWVGLSGRVRTLVYNTETVAPDELPTSVTDLTESRYAGRVGVAPNSGSFQDFVTAMRVVEGDDATKAWLAAMGDNDSPNYPSNSAIVEAVGRGEIDMGLVNHYYNLRAKEADPSVPSENYFFPDGDVGSVVMVSGAGIVVSSQREGLAQQLLAFMLSDDVQRDLVSGQQEYAIVASAGVTGPPESPPLSALGAAPLDFAELGDGLMETQRLIRDSGIDN